MGWWWGQDRQAQAPTTDAPTAPIPLEVQAIAKDATGPPQTPDGSPKKLSRDEQAYEELKGLFSQIDPERTIHAAAKAKETVNKEPEDYSNSIYASTMSCSQCFDQAYYCSSIGGQLNNIYRFGSLRACSDLWAQWRFCMRTKTMSEELKKTKVREFNQQKAVKYKIGRSSEDVWEVRKEPVEHPFMRITEH